MTTGRDASAIKAVIFDLDGTLLNTLPSIAHFANRALAKQGYPSIPEDEYRYLVGEGAPVLIRKMLLRAGGDPETDFDAVLQSYRAEYDANTTYKTKYYDGMLDLLGALHRLRVDLAVLSNKPQVQVQNLIRAFFPGGLFAAVYGAMEGLKRKPDPDGVFRIAKELHHTPEECLYLGDTAIDMQTGVRAGCLTIGAGWGFRDEGELLTNGARAVAMRPEQVLRFL